MTQNRAETTTLSNGIRIVTQTMPQTKTAAIGIWVQVGSRYETSEENGLSHFIEHMVFKGTKSRSPLQIAQEIEAVGGVLNAHTSREHTGYYARVLSEDVPLAFDVISEMVHVPLFDEKELRREQEVVLQEIHQAHDAPDDVVFDEYQETAYPEQSLGRPVLGTAETIKSFQTEDLWRYLKKHYTGHRIIVSAVGNFSHDHIVDMAAKKLSHISPGEASGVHESRYRGGYKVLDRDLEQIHLLLGFEGCDYQHKDYYTNAILASTLGGGMSSRLFQEVREKRGLAYSISSFCSSYFDGGLFSIYASTTPEHFLELLPIIGHELGTLASTLKESEIRKSKAQFKAGLLMALESVPSRCEQLANQLLIFGHPVSDEEIIQKINAVTLPAVKAWAGDLFSTPHTFAALGPTKHLKRPDLVFDQYLKKAS